MRIWEKIKNLFRRPKYEEKPITETLRYVTITFIEKEGHITAGGEIVDNERVAKATEDYIAEYFGETFIADRDSVQEKCREGHFYDYSHKPTSYLVEYVVTVTPAAKEQE